MIYKDCIESSAYYFTPQTVIFLVKYIFILLNSFFIDLLFRPLVSSNLCLLPLPVVRNSTRSTLIGEST